MRLISPSILSSDFSILGEEAAACERAGADMLHIDVMDGHFVPNLTLGAPIVRSLRKRASLPFDLHLMISQPQRYIPDFAAAGADLITFHYESEGDPAETVRQIRDLGKKAGVSLKPGTVPECLLPLLPSLDMILVMTVEPGFGGQKFRADMTEKIRFLRGRCEEQGLSPYIEVDGGVTPETLPLAAEAGADVFVAGSFVFSAPDRRAAIEALRNA